MECVIVRVLCLVGVVACEKFYHLNLFASRAYKARHNYYGDGYVACSFQDLWHCARQKAVILFLNVSAMALTAIMGT